VHPFDLKTALMARHAQHVALIHFPVALFAAGVAFDAFSTRKERLADAAYYNLMLAAISTIPVLGTGLLAWQLQLAGQRLKGVLLLHLIFAGLSTVLIWIAAGLHLRARRMAQAAPAYRWAVEFAGVIAVLLTAHLGGFLSGVNGP
jgi:uncharacterized membrane protein